MQPFQKNKIAGFKSTAPQRWQPVPPKFANSILQAPTPTTGKNKRHETIDLTALPPLVQHAVSATAVTNKPSQPRKRKIAGFTREAYVDVPQQEQQRPAAARPAVKKAILKRRVSTGVLPPRRAGTAVPAIKRFSGVAARCKARKLGGDFRVGAGRNNNNNKPSDAAATQSQTKHVVNVQPSPAELMREKAEKAATAARLKEKKKANKKPKAASGVNILDSVISAMEAESERVGAKERREKAEKAEKAENKPTAALAKKPQSNSSQSTATNREAQRRQQQANNMQSSALRLIEDYKQDPFMLNIKGREFAQKGAWECALQLLDAAIAAAAAVHQCQEKNDLLAAAHNNRGACLGNLHRHAEALCAFREATTMSPDNPQYAANAQQAEDSLWRANDTTLQWEAHLPNQNHVVGQNDGAQTGRSLNAAHQPPADHPLKTNQPQMRLPLDNNQPPMRHPLDTNQPPMGLPLDTNQPPMGLPLDTNQPPMGLPLDTNQPPMGLPLDTNQHPMGHPMGHPLGAVVDQSVTDEVRSQLRQLLESDALASLLGRPNSNQQQQPPPPF